MRHIFSRDKQSGGEKRDWLDFVLKGKVLPRLGIALVVTVSVVIGVLFYQGKLANLAELEYIRFSSYPGIFVVSMIWNSTVLVPVPSFWTYFFWGTVFNPLLVGLAGGCGAATGELTAYMAGRSGRAMIRGKRFKVYTRVEDWIRKWGLLVVFGFNLVPFFPFDVVGIAAGVARFSLWRYYLVVAAGRSISYGFIAFAGSRGWIPPLPFLNLPD
jgi:uncharacterized membrane protein YdjX (TVP38/TMEM64 family)